MSALFLEIHPENPEPRKVKQALDIIKNGGLVVYPTDTIYGLGCDITNNKAVERICKIKGVKPEKASFSFICPDLSKISFYARPFNNNVYKIMKKNLPGPFTFILNASNQIPKMLKNNRKTIGIRVPNSPIVAALVEGLETPIMSTSIINLNNTDDEILKYPTDPFEIYEMYKNLVDLVIDGGFGGNQPSTIVDCTADEVEIIREGLGELVY